MGSAIALVVGVPQPHPNSGWRADRLPGVLNDVVSMRRFFDARGFQTTELRESNATAGAVLRSIEAAYGALGAGDIFAFHFSGHGGTLPDTNDHDEARDQLLLTYDQPILDDVLGRYWGQFAAGVRIVVSTDSCFSGTVVRTLESPGGTVVQREVVQRQRLLSIGLDQHSGTRRVGGRIDNLKADLIHFAAALDSQKALDITSNGLFTDCFLRAWDLGYKRSYQQLHEGTAKLMGQRAATSSQQCAMTSYGDHAADFEQQAPYESNAGSVTNPFAGLIDPFAELVDPFAT